MKDYRVKDITVLNNGTIIRDPRRFVCGIDINESGEQIELPVFSYLLNTSDGYILIDTGFNEDILENKEGQAQNRKLGKFGLKFHISNVLEQVNVKVDEIRFVIMTHLHYDHAGGLKPFADRSTKILAQKDEIEYALFSGLCYGDAFYRHKDLPAGNNWVPITQNYFGISNSIRLLKVGGHTAGSQIIDVTTMKGNKYLILGDLVHMHEEYDKENTGEAALTNEFIIWKNAIRQIKFFNEKTETKYLFNHDRRLMDKKELVFE